MSFLCANERLSGSGPVKAAAIARISGPISAVVRPDLIPLLVFPRDVEFHGGGARHAGGELARS